MQTTKTYPCVMTIAGSDSSGGAGIQADIKAISATGSYAASAITVLTAQNTQGVQDIYAVPPAFVVSQMDAVFSDIEVKAVKIGALLNQEIIEAVAKFLKKRAANNIVLDPVMVSKSGSELLQANAIETLKKELLCLATLVTPNLSEAEKLVAGKIADLSQMEAAARSLGDQYQTNILIKGGHLHAEDAVDVLYMHQDARCYRYSSERIHTKNTHGTGCTLSSAIASYLAQGYLLTDAIAAAKQYLTRAIEAGRNLGLGKGYGPLAHFYHLESCES